jgi:hypothetical protein
MHNRNSIWYRNNIYGLDLGDMIMMVTDQLVLSFVGYVISHSCKLWMLATFDLVIVGLIDVGFANAHRILYNITLLNNCIIITYFILCTVLHNAVNLDITNIKKIISIWDRNSIYDLDYHIFQFDFWDFFLWTIEWNIHN